MLLSIFPNIKPLPTSGEDKKEAAKKATHPETVQVHNEDDLIRLITNYVWSPSIFEGTRSKSNFISTDFLVLDIDDGLTIEEAEERVQEANITCLCMASMSHASNHHRFRLVFPLVRSISNYEMFLHSMEDLYEAFPEADRATISDSARLFFQSNDQDGFWFEGDLLVPVKPPQKLENSFKNDSRSFPSIVIGDDIKELITEIYGEDRVKIPEAVDFFIRNANSGLPGNWTVSLNAFCFVLTLQDVEEDVIYDLVEYLAPDELDKKDKATIHYAIRDGKRIRDE